MKQVYVDALYSIILFIGSIFMIFIPPIKLGFTILGFIGMIVALCLLVMTLVVEACKDE